MAVKRNPKPLSILVSKELSELPEIKSLATKGHTLEVIPPEWEKYDIIFSPFAWRMTSELSSLVDVSIKARRAVKFKKAKKDEDDE